MGHKYKFRSLVGAEGRGPESFWGSIDAAHFFIISPTLLFRRDQHNRTLVPYAFPAVSSRRWLGAKLKFVCCRRAFIGSGASLNNALSSGSCVRRSISFNACKQLWNADRLGDKWMSLICRPDLASAFLILDWRSRKSPRF